MVEDHRPAATLDALEAARVAIEAQYLECMHGLEMRADALRALLDELALGSTGADQDDASPPQPKPVVRSSTVAVVATAEPTGVVAQPESGRPASGLRARLAVWLLGDQVLELDRREAAMEGAVSGVRDDVATLRAEVSVALDRIQQDVATDLDAARANMSKAQEQQRAALAEARHDALRRWHGVGEALDQAVEALTQVTRLSEGLRSVVDAKDAEGLQRAVEGPTLQIEVIVDELTRRQEALLAELVGRRQELDELIESASRK